MQRLGQLEAVVMEWLWSYDEPASVREVLEDLSRDRKIAYTTVMTVLHNLHRKRLVSRSMDGRAYRYLPAYSREQYSALLMEDVLATSSDRAATLLHFLEQMPAADVARLRAALSRTKPRRGGS